MALNLKEKELVAVGASVSAGCRPCTNYHIKKVREAGASDEAIKQAISDTMSLCASANKIMEIQALKHLEITKNTNDCGCSEGSSRQKTLVSVAAAFAVNSASNLEKHIELARSEGVSDNEIKSVLDITLAIKFKAASHVDRIAEKIGTHLYSEDNNSAQDKNACGCSGDC